MRYAALLALLVVTGALADGMISSKHAQSSGPSTAYQTSWLAASEDRQRAVIYWRDGD